jgi:polysaccharide biosynthesis protein VpsJ
MTTSVPTASTTTPLDIARATLARTRAQGWAGADPYDGLEGPIGALVRPLGPLPRFALSQTVLRSPLARVAAMPRATVNPKALGLFLGTLARLGVTGQEHEDPGVGAELLDAIADRATTQSDDLGWGYPFGWQSRHFWAPPNLPNAVVTSTVAWHLFEYADRAGDNRARSMAVAGARFLASSLSRSKANGGEAIAYTPKDRTQVINVSALAARVLSRAAPDTSPRLREIATRLVCFVLAHQREDGSWPYSTEARGQWEDSFHTGYILESLIHVQSYGVDVPHASLRAGFEAYERFFGPSGEARLLPRPDSVLDAHAAAQGILTYATLAVWTEGPRSLRDTGAARALAIARWAMDELWLSDRGHFAYRVRRGRKDEREFTRWVTAWMCLAMAVAAELTAHGSARPLVPTPGSEVA